MDYIVVFFFENISSSTKYYNIEDLDLILKIEILHKI